MRRCLNSFLACVSGNFAMMASVLMIPIVAAGGLAVDYANLTRLRSDMQSAVDAAALAAAREVDMTVAQRRRLAESFFASNNLEQSVQRVSVTIVGDKVTVKVDAKPKTLLMGTIDIGDVNFSIEGSASTRPNAMEIVLALDVSGSMNATMASVQRRIEELKKSVNTLIDKGV